MKLAHILTGFLLLIGFAGLTKSGLSFVENLDDYNSVEQLELLTEARAEWSGGTVAMAFERSVTQVALALDSPITSGFRNLIDQQREKADNMMSAAKDTLSGLPDMPTLSGFIQSQARIRAEVSALRQEMDAMLSRPASERDPDRLRDGPLELKQLIVELQVLTSTLAIDNNLTSLQAIVLARIQEKAWEVREFAGRARTYYAVATLTGRPIPESVYSEIKQSNTRAQNAFSEIQQLRGATTLPAELSSQISAAESAYFGEYKNIISQLDGVMARNAGAETIDYPISFEDFFALSNNALDQVVGVSRVASASLVDYWLSRAALERTSLIIDAVIMAAVIMLIGFAVLFTRKRIVARIEDVCRELAFVTSGDLSRVVEQKKNDLGEIASLTDNVEDLRGRLSEAQQARDERAAEREAQNRLVAALTDGLSRLSHGDFSGQIHEEFGSDHNQLRDDFNATCTQLRSVIGMVVKSGEAIGEGANEVSAATKDLASRTESQAASLEETAAALDELSTSVSSTAQGAKQANEKVKAARMAAQDSGQVVDRAIGAMDQIKASSDEMSTIIGLIHDIAFQTNLLALNAGVEAARAGDAGRGFAVVASEVRGLAQRASDAAKQIGTLISDSKTQVEQGVTLVAQTGSSLTDIVSMVEEISGLVADMSTAAHEQSSNLTEVNSSVTHLDRVTQQNAGMVQQVSESSSKMSDNAHDLRSLTARFVLSSQDEQKDGPRRRLRLSA